jgi:K+-transporting ATPase A subunit
MGNFVKTNILRLILLVLFPFTLVVAIGMAIWKALKLEFRDFFMIMKNPFIVLK